MRDFDLASDIPITEGCTVLIVGGRGTGKTTLAKRVAGDATLAEGAVVCNAAEKERPDYAEVLPPGEVSTEFDSAAISRLLDRQLRQQFEGGHPAACIFEDCLDRGWQRDLYVRKLFANAKRLKVRAVLTVDMAPQLTPFVRDNIDVVFLARDTNEVSVTRAFAAYGNDAGFATLDEFANAFFRLTSRPFEFMAIDRRKPAGENAVTRFAFES